MRHWVWTTLTSRDAQSGHERTQCIAGQLHDLRPRPAGPSYTVASQSSGGVDLPWQLTDINARASRDPDQYGKDCLPTTSRATMILFIWEVCCRRTPCPSGRACVAPADTPRRTQCDRVSIWHRAPRQMPLRDELPPKRGGRQDIRIC